MKTWRLMYTEGFKSFHNFLILLMNEMNLTKRIS